MAAPYTPTAASRFYSAPPSMHHVGMGYLWDADALITGVNVQPTTGAWRAITPEDFSDIVLTGSNITVAVGNVAVTGVTNVTGVTQSPSATTTNNYVPSGNVGSAMVTGQILDANPNRVQTYIQNIGSGSALYVKLGSAPAGQDSFSLILAAASADWGANGGVYSNIGTYKGPVSISGSTRYIAWQM